MTPAHSFKKQARNGILAKIHIAKKTLALEDTSYRRLLHSVTDKQSCADMDNKELEAVLAEFKRLGFKPKKAPKRAGKKPMAQTPQASKIRALWLDLYHIGEIENPSEEALTAFCKRMAGVEAMQWMTSYDANKIIKALRGWLARVGVHFPDSKVIEFVYMMRSAHYPREEVDAHFVAQKLYIILAQCRILQTEKTIDAIERFGFDRPQSMALIKHDQLDPIIEKLGAAIRRGKK